MPRSPVTRPRRSAPKKTPAGAGVEEEMGDTDRIGAPYGTVTVWLTLLVAPSSSVTVNVTVYVPALEYL